jgi:hypothetical protein
MLASLQVHDEFLGCLRLSVANRDCSAALKSDLNNQYGFGKDLYPKSPYQCLSLLNHRSEAPVRALCLKPNAPVVKEREALVFAQGYTGKKIASKQCDNGSKQSSASSTSSQTIRIIICKICGKIGHTSSICPEANPELVQNIHPAKTPIQVHCNNHDYDQGG